MARQYPASKTQLRKLAELGLEHGSNVTYPEAAQLLEDHGWDGTGSVHMFADHRADMVVDGRLGAQ